MAFEGTIIAVKPLQALEFKEFEDFFRLPNLATGPLGFYLSPIPLSRSKKILYRLVTMCGIIICLWNRINLAQMYIENLASLPLTDIFFAGSSWCYSLESHTKMLSLYWFRKRLHRIYAILEENYPKTVTERKSYGVNNFYKESAQPLIIKLYYYSLAVVFCVPLITSCISYFNEQSKNPANAQFAYERPHVNSYYFPDHNPLGYFLAYFLDGYVFFFLIHGSLGADLWLINFTAQCCMQFQNIAKRIEEYKPSVENSRKDCAYLCKIIQKHQLMLDLMEEMQSVFSLSLFFSLLTTAGLTILIALVTTFSDSIATRIRFFMFIFFNMIQFYVRCDFGEKLIDSSASIAEAAYQCAWYEGSPAFKKLILVIMIRGQKSANLTAGGIIPYSRITFDNLVGATYRFYAALQASLQG